MRIAIDARMIDHPGIGTYIRNILRGLLKCASGNEIVLYGDPAKLSEFPVEKKMYTASVYSYNELFRSPLAKDKFDLVHIPHFNAPFGKINNLVVTIHDLIYIKVAQSGVSPFKKTVAKWMFANALNKAKVIIAVSNNTRNDLIEYFPHAKDKITVIYEAAELEYKKITDRQKLNSIKQKYNLPENFILFVGSIRKHKNIERLLDAYLYLKQKGRACKLVIIGRHDTAQKRIFDKIKASDVLCLGNVVTGDLPAIYNLADLFVFPSLYEGFGLPVLEAMACGLPVVTSAVSSLKEVAGDAALFCDPLDHKDIALKIEIALGDKGLRNTLIEKGLKQAASFSWDKAAKDTLEVYRKAVS